MRPKETQLRLVQAALILFILGGSLGCLNLLGGQSGESAAQAAGQDGESVVIKYLSSALGPGGGAARLYYRGTCRGDDLLFPAIAVHPPAKDERGIKAVREMFRGDKDVTVSEAHPGIVRIVIGSVFTRILSTRVPSLRLRRSTQYDVYGAILAIEEAKAVRAAMRKLGVRQAPGGYDYLAPVPAKGLPHLPYSLKTGTIDEMLDSIAETFSGVVTYGECPEPHGGHLWNIWFSSLQAN